MTRSISSSGIQEDSGVLNNQAVRVEVLASRLGCAWGAVHYVHTYGWGWLGNQWAVSSIRHAETAVGLGVHAY